MASFQHLATFRSCLGGAEKRHFSGIVRPSRRAYRPGLIARTLRDAKEQKVYQSQYINPRCANASRYYSHQGAKASPYRPPSQPTPRQQAETIYADLSRRPVRVLGPALWCFGAAFVIYLGCASYEVYQDVQETKKRHAGMPLTFGQAMAVGHNRRVRAMFSTYTPGPGLKAWWDSEPSSSKVVYGAMAINAAMFALTQASPAVWMHMGHIPAWNRNYTLFTSLFGHHDIWHLGFNMYALYNFAQPVAKSPLFAGSGSHLAAFYLSAGLFAGAFSQATAAWPATHTRVAFSMGASGAIFGILGAFGTLYPDSGIGIVFVPLYIPASNALMAIAAFEAWGVIKGYRWLNWGHGAHLGGLLFGVGYAYLDGNKHLWLPFKRFAFDNMRRLNVI